VEQRYLFFAKFTPCENEQLACVHVYLYRRLSLAFNEVTDHDVLWEEIPIGVSLDREETSGWKEHYLSLGLEFLHRLVLADTYDRRYALLAPNLSRDDLFLDAGLLVRKDDDDDVVSEDNEEGYGHIIELPTTGGDTGPIEAWRWANGYVSCAQIYYAEDKADLRGWGYCMWDRVRLMAWGAFGKSRSRKRARKRRQRLREETLLYREERTSHRKKDREFISIEGGVGGVREIKVGLCGKSMENGRFCPSHYHYQTTGVGEPFLARVCKTMADF